MSTVTGAHTPLYTYIYTYSYVWQVHLYLNICTHICVCVSTNPPMSVISAPVRLPYRPGLTFKGPSCKQGLRKCELKRLEIVNSELLINSKIKKITRGAFGLKADLYSVVILLFSHTQPTMASCAQFGFCFVQLYQIVCINQRVFLLNLCSSWAR